MTGNTPIAVVVAMVLSLPGAARAEASAPGATAIGLFLAADDAASAAATEVRRGAEIAVEDCAPGLGACRVVATASAGQWSAGAGELVRLVYSEGVRAVLGPVDGRSAHLAEQVVARAKGRFLLLTPWASDPTLTQIKVPWMFRLVPDDRQQAESLLEEIYGVRKLHMVAVVVAESGYDVRMAAEAFEKVAATRNAPVPHKLVVGEQPGDLARLAAGLHASGAQAVLLLAPPDLAARAARALREAKITAAFFGPLALAAPAFLDVAGAAAEGMVLAAPPDASGAAADRFRGRYRMAYNREPSTPAAYGYDGAAVLIDALQSQGSGNDVSLRAALAAIHREGLTGRIEFTPAGNRAGPAPLVRVERGRLVPILNSSREIPLSREESVDFHES